VAQSVDTVTSAVADPQRSAPAKPLAEAQ
jgi:hypothetical protein